MYDLLMSWAKNLDSGCQSEGSLDRELSVRSKVIMTESCYWIVSCPPSTIFLIRIVSEKEESLGIDISKNGRPLVSSTLISVREE